MLSNEGEYLKVTMNTEDGCVLNTNVSVSIKPMDSPSICIVSIDSTNKNIIYWEKPVSTAIDSFLIFRETNVTNKYNRIGAVSSSDNSMFIDTSSFPNIQSNKYQISVKDACGYESDRSLPHKTIHLTISQGQNNAWNLIWEPYIGFDISTYYIYRGTNLHNLQLIGTTSASSAQYTDFSASAGTVFYQIEVVSPYDCNLNIKNAKLKTNAISKAAITSRSNIATNNPTGINESIASPSQFSIYPNPADDILFIESNQIDIMNGEIEIRNTEGKILKSASVSSSKMKMDISKLKSGFYIITIKTNLGLTTYKIVKK